jgi:hypothetical protein
MRQRIIRLNAFDGTCVWQPRSDDALSKELVDRGDGEWWSTSAKPGQRGGRRVVWKERRGWGRCPVPALEPSFQRRRGILNTFLRRSMLRCLRGVTP